MEKIELRCEFAPDGGNPDQHYFVISDGGQVMSLIPFFPDEPKSEIVSRLTYAIYCAACCPDTQPELFEHFAGHLLDRVNLPLADEVATEIRTAAREMVGLFPAEEDVTQ